MRAFSFRGRLIWAAFGPITLGFISAAMAQSASLAPSAASSAAGGLETITVTARKKSESLQKVPLSITAISKRDLQNSHVQNLYDIVALTPGVNITDLGAEVGTSITIRGVTDLTFGVNIPDVATFLDGTYLRDPAAINIAAAGLSQVEIVKGPVSALYGRDAYSGIINYVTERPTSTPHANLEYTVGDYGKEEVQVSVSGPIWQDKVFGKIFGTYDYFNGTYKDPVSDQRAGGDEKKDLGGLLDVNWNANIATHFDLYYGYDYLAKPLPRHSPQIAGITPKSVPMSCIAAVSAPATR